MPYIVNSHCKKCNQGDEFTIGLWPEHLGVFICQACKRIENIPLKTGQCPDCGYAPSIEEFYDYSYSVPYLGGQRQRESGPLCPKCQEDQLTFETTAHINVGRLGSEDGIMPWMGKDYLEKAIFVYALMAICSEFEIEDPKEILDYYNVDVPTSLILNRKLSIPIMLDIRAHLLAVAMAGNPPFQVTQRFKEAMEEEFRELINFIEE